MYHLGSKYFAVLGHPCNRPLWLCGLTNALCFLLPVMLLAANLSAHRIDLMDPATYLINDNLKSLSIEGLHQGGDPGQQRHLSMTVFHVCAAQGRQTHSSQTEQQALRATRNMYPSTPLQARTLFIDSHSLQTKSHGAPGATCLHC